EHLAAVDRDRLPGDPAGIVAREEERHVGDLLGGAHAPERNGAADPGVELRLLAPRLVPYAIGKLDGARRDAVDADALARELGGLGAGVLDQGGLDGAVGRRADTGRQPRDGGDVDDGRARAHRQVREGGTTGAYRPEQVHLDARRPAGFVVGPAETRGVVHQDVDAAQRAGRRRHVVGDAVGLREVAAGGLDRAAAFGELRLGGSQRFLAPGADGHVRALRRETERDRPADPAAAAGHDDAASLELSCHWMLLRAFTRV